MRLLISLLFILLVNQLDAQTKIDSCFSFQTDPCKNYSLYLPSSYDSTVPNKLMLGFHPFNTSRWDARAWRDTLIAFAELNNLLLVCPDGGPDGQVDNPIDTAFTTALLDSINTWYNINDDEKYIMGFSWGGRTTYTYGLRRTETFKGYLIIGAAVDIGQVNPILDQAKGEPFYLVHGSNDIPNVRFNPLRDGLNENEACVETQLLQGIGHTIDFPNRNEILTEAFNWLENSNCGTSSNSNLKKNDLHIYPNPSHSIVNIDNIGNYEIQAFDIAGKKVAFNLNEQSITFNNSQKGIVYLIFSNGASTFSKKIILE